MDKKPSKNDLYEAVYQEDTVWLEEILKTGMNADNCSGVGGWYDSNTLAVLASGFYNSNFRKSIHDVIPNPIPDVSTLHILLSYGANINKRPYIWFRIILYENSSINRKTNQWKQRLELNKITPEEYTNGLNAEIQGYVEDSNRLIRAFIEAGADPDMKGHPKPFEQNILTQLFMSDKKAARYFSNGTRPINEAIKKGIHWESQVDLLLEYVQLDEDSLVAAQESNDPAMVAKINALWEKQKSEK